LPKYVHGKDVQWLRADGEPMSDHDWSQAMAFYVVLSETRTAGAVSAVALLINATDAVSTIELPNIDGVHDWNLVFSSAVESAVSQHKASLPALTLSLAIPARD
jgi:pullulanase/glycogen debranching enzyme